MTNSAPMLQTLAEIDHPIAAMIIEHRQISKLLSDLDSYCSGREVRRVAGPANSVSSLNISSVKISAKVASYNWPLQTALVEN